MKLNNVRALKKKINKLVCVAIIFCTFCMPVSAMRYQAERIIDREDPPEISERIANRATNNNLTQLDLGENFLFKADPSTVQRYFEIFNEFDGAVNQNSFNFSQAQQIANKNGMLSSGSIDNSINQSSGNVTYAMSQINTLFSSKLSSILSDDARNVISKVIQDTFNTHISSSNYIVYSSKSGSENSYLFKVLAGSVTVNGNQSMLTLVPVEITVHVKVKVKKVLFVTVSKSKHYDVQVKAQAFKKVISL
jgi:hypothetical protein